MTANERQAAAWNGPEAAHYVDHADRYDRQLAPFGDAMLAAAAIEGHESVLDVGCGSGATTLMAARLARRAVGVDISRPLLDVAERRARELSLAAATFELADAQQHRFDPPFDVLVSQFGLMFFDDPGAAFTNLHTALVSGGRIAFVCWQPIAANEWLTVLGRAAAVELPDLGGLGAGPGMFALRDPTEIRSLLTDAGFEAVTVDPVEPTILVGGGGSFDDSIEFLLGIGIVRGLLGDALAADRAAVIASVRDSLAPHMVAGEGVRLGAAGWLVGARRP